jgi:hypothetical protein
MLFALFWTHSESIVLDQGLYLVWIRFPVTGYRIYHRPQGPTLDRMGIRKEIILTDPDPGRQCWGSLTYLCGSGSPDPYL